MVAEATALLSKSDWPGKAARGVFS